MSEISVSRRPIRPQDTPNKASYWRQYEASSYLVQRHVLLHEGTGCGTLEARADKFPREGPLKRTAKIEGPEGTACNRYKCIREFGIKAAMAPMLIKPRPHAALQCRCRAEAGPSPIDRRFGGRTADSLHPAHAKICTRRQALHTWAERQTTLTFAAYVPIRKSIPRVRERLTGFRQARGSI